MAFFDNRTPQDVAEGVDEPNEQTPEESASESIKLGDQEYTQEELQKYVGLGKTAEEYESKYDTNFENAWKAYGKTTNQNKELTEEIERLKNEAETKPALPENQEQAIKEAQEAARNLGIVTKEDFKALLDESFSEKYIAERQAERLLDGMRDLEGEYNGADGRPKFEVESMLEYMRDTGIQDPKIAYKVRFDTELSEWAGEKIEAAKKPGLTTETKTTAGSKQPKEVKPTKDNLDELVSQALRGEL